MFDILIIGGGHAGVEACHIASQFNDLNIGLISLPEVGLASAPCNPSIGGVGKGQVVKEIDSLGGIIGRLADLAGIQYRTLNESKGYAVQSTRIQIDKIDYSKHAEKILSDIPNLTIIRDKISSVGGSDGEFIVGCNSNTYKSKKIIMTVGTFLNGKMHIGQNQSEGGREGCENSSSLHNIFSGIKTRTARFKTGTPARLNINSISYSKLEEQPSDNCVQNFHLFHQPSTRFKPQVSCFLAYTNHETMKIIRDNKDKSPMFNGQIKGVGARYCPSIEDKAYRYPDKNVHHVFVEPESHKLNTVYPSGISTSLPKDIQDKLIKSINGMECAKIECYGYAVEYDVIDTTNLFRTLEMKSIPGLYFAGQVNGTSGYEEAAGQGFIAGSNAALSIMNQDPLILSRRDSYIGVMIEDLVSNLRDEPYRLFTARSENRLYIREDNAPVRMYPYRFKLGLSKPIDYYLSEFVDGFYIYNKILNEFFIDPESDIAKILNVKVPRRTSIADCLKQPCLNPISALGDLFISFGLEVDQRLIRTLAISIKYDGYINKSNDHLNKLNKLDTKKISWQDLMDSENISFECKQRILAIKPETFGQLKIIEGIRPATLAAVAGRIG